MFGSVGCKAFGFSLIGTWIYSWIIIIIRNETYKYAAVLKPTAEKTEPRLLKTILLRNARISAVEIYKESTYTITIHNKCVYLSKLKRKTLGWTKTDDLAGFTKTRLKSQLFVKCCSLNYTKYLFCIIWDFLDSSPFVCFRVNLFWNVRVWVLVHEYTGV